MADSSSRTKQQLVEWIYLIGSEKSVESKD